LIEDEECELALDLGSREDTSFSPSWICMCKLWVFCFAAGFGDYFFPGNRDWYSVLIRQAETAEVKTGTQIDSQS
jgi:hypothetical protein